MLWIENIVVESTHVPPLELTWLILWILARWLLEGVHFRFVQVHKMKVKPKQTKN
jgi:hypothetical protein